MKKIILTFLSLIIILCTVNAQRGINFNKNYAAGGKLLMCVDSSAKNVYYALGFPNQPHTSFNYLPEVNNLSIQINFRKNINIEQYRYSIIVDDTPIAVNKSIDKTKLKDTHAGGDEEIFSSTSLGVFPIKGKMITILGYSIDKPQDVDKTIFYGKLFFKSKINHIIKQFKTDKGFDYSHIANPKEKTDIKFDEKDDLLDIVKDISDIDNMYSLSIKDKLTDKIIFESRTWKFGGYQSKDNEPYPYVKIDKNVFKKSGDYEIIIQPSIDWTNCLDCDISSKEVEKYTSRYTLSITLDEENYTKKDFLLFSIIIGGLCGAIFVAILNNRKRKAKKKIDEEIKQKQTAQLQLNSVRSQLNPHFLFNALAGIQNLMNKNDTENANKYLSKFARLTRNVLESKELISLTEEKTLLYDYLQMEQLRFGFQYTINTQADLDTENIEIPAMLLQPLVENAVKHGITEKGKDGEIAISFEKQVSNLLLKITDNGSGFDATQTYDGLGLALSKNRISLLNTVYKDTPFILNIQSDTNGTTITITLSQWL